MQRDTTRTYTLNRKEVREAVMAWLREKGEPVSDRARITLDDGEHIESLIVSDQESIIEADTK